jgi:hypothetical protein
MKEIVEMPKGAKETIVRALDLYQKFLDQATKIDSESDAIAFERFDVIGLLGIFNEETAQIEIRIERDARECFASKHNVDFPMWNC